ncbi:MAG: hypothetical protein U1D69_02835 [Polynucleobacter sp.]|nr:hypothetical protein [Polynucleobacter sp.]
MDEGLKISAGQEDLRVTFEAAARRIIKVDVERYQSYLDDTGMTDQQRKDFLQAMWLVMMSFVEMGFEVHPIQHVCGKASSIGNGSSTRELDKVSFTESHKDERDQEPRP